MDNRYFIKIRLFDNLPDMPDHGKYKQIMVEAESVEEVEMLIDDKNGKVKAWLLEEISDVRKKPFYEDDSREAGRLDGRIECAENLLEQITKWEKK